MNALSELDERMMRRALELAEEAGKQGEVPIGAVVYRGEEILGEGANRREVDDDPVAHAEVLAIREASKTIGDWRLNECSMVVTLEPCPMCAGAIVNARVGRVIFGALDPKAGAVESLHRLLHDERLNHSPTEVIGGVLAEESAELLRSFFRNLRKKN